MNKKTRVSLIILLLLVLPSSIYAGSSRPKDVNRSKGFLVNDMSPVTVTKHFIQQPKEYIRSLELYQEYNPDSNGEFLVIFASHIRFVSSGKGTTQWDSINVKRSQARKNKDKQKGVEYAKSTIIYGRGSVDSNCYQDLHVDQWYCHEITSPKNQNEMDIESIRAIEFAESIGLSFSHEEVDTRFGGKVVRKYYK